ncbi:MAG: hypothetical protein L6R38_009337 [Xanthoria sp. 2 TBL-2021]|nr:MAG: hypothetical protein L6R38_009337 [Xanthoria sp. 2 TBL-2021]
METASKLPTDLHNQHAGNDNIAATNNGPVQENPLSNLRSRLPQELVDQIRYDFLDAALLPGYFSPHLWNQESYIWDEKPVRRIARPGMLTLNKRTYETYRHRIWTDNTCVHVLKGEESKYCELIPVKGHLSNPYDYLTSYFDNEGEFCWLESEIETRRQRSLSRGPHYVPLVQQPEHHVTSVRILFNFLSKRPGSRETLDCLVSIVDAYDAHGQWYDAWPPDNIPEDENSEFIRRAFRRMVQQPYEQHEGRRREKANTSEWSHLHMSVVKDASMVRFFCFT